MLWEKSQSVSQCKFYLRAPYQWIHRVDFIVEIYPLCYGSFFDGETTNGRANAWCRRGFYEGKEKDQTKLRHAIRESYHFDQWSF